MNDSDLAATIRSLLPPTAPVEGIDDDLLAAGLLDSAAVLGLVAGIEKSFGITIDTANLTEENFRSLRTIAAMVRRLLDAGDRP